jgi:hypothetical protein
VNPDLAATPEENVLLAIMAVQRVVNNGICLDRCACAREHRLRRHCRAHPKSLDALNLHPLTLKAIGNRIKFRADPLRRHGAELPRSSEFFRANFPQVSLSDPPAPRLQLVNGKVKRT